MREEERRGKEAMRKRRKEREKVNYLNRGIYCQVANDVVGGVRLEASREWERVEGILSTEVKLREGRMTSSNLDQCYNKAMAMTIL